MSHFKKRLQLFQYKSFRWYLAMCFLVNIGSGLAYISITWMTLTDHNSVTSVAIAMLCFWVPNVIFGPFMGVLVDRFKSRNQLLAYANWIRGIALIMFSVYFLNHHSLHAIYLLSIIQGLLFSVFFSVSARLTREIIPKKDLLYANATIDMAFETGNILGMGLAGILIGWIGASGTLAIDAFTFILGGVCMIFVKKENAVIDIAAETMRLNTTHFLGDFKEGLRYTFKDKAILVIYTIQLFLFLEYLISPVLLAPYARNILHATSSQFGRIEAALSIGVVIGGVFLSWISDRFGFTRTMLITMLVSGGAYFYFSHNHSMLMANVLYFLLGICFAAWPLIITQAQHMTQIDYQGRVQSCFSSISGMFLILIYLSITFLGKYISIQTLFGFQILFALLGSILIVYFSYRFSYHLSKKN